MSFLILALSGALHMKRPQYEYSKEIYGLKGNGNKGASAVEMAIILPILVLMVFGAIDFGRLFHARQIMTNTAREGASLASREISLPTGTYSAANLIDLLQAGASPLDMASRGRIYIWRIAAGTSEDEPDPTIDASKSAAGALGADSTIGTGKSNLGLDSDVYQHLVYDPDNDTANIAQITVVEVFYEYRPLIPIIMGNQILSSRAVF